MGGVLVGSVFGNNILVHLDDGPLGSASLSTNGNCLQIGVLLDVVEVLFGGINHRVLDLDHPVVSSLFLADPSFSCDFYGNVSVFWTPSVVASVDSVGIHESDHTVSTDGTVGLTDLAVTMDEF